MSSDSVVYVPVSRSPLGERGLKYILQLLLCIGYRCRSPLGERGLKSACSHLLQYGCIVALRLESVD